MIIIIEHCVNDDMFLYMRALNNVVECERMTSIFTDWQWKYNLIIAIFKNN